MTEEDGRHTRDYKDFWSVVAVRIFLRLVATSSRVGTDGGLVFARTSSNSAGAGSIFASCRIKRTKSGFFAPVLRWILLALGGGPVRLFQIFPPRKTKLVNAGFD